MMKKKLFGMMLAVGLMGTAQEIKAVNNVQLVSIAAASVVGGCLVNKFSGWGARKIKDAWNVVSNDTKKAALVSLTTLAIATIGLKMCKVGYADLPNFSLSEGINLEIAK